MDQKEPIDRITGRILAKLQNQVNLKNRQVADESGSTSGGAVRVPADVAPYIDHTLLKPEATREQIDRLCDEAVKYSFYSVCVNSSWVSICAGKRRDTFSYRLFIAIMGS